ncbi:MAG: hypothetical protein JNN15_16670, partial [Blastocatellia bacterium]|nr:hypothetical protein [Blastocatellia bacterium]
DHSYARGRASSINDYNHWEELVADCSRGYSRLFFGKGLNDIERYHFENIYKRLLETHLSFFDLQTPSIFTPADLKIDNFSKNKRPEDNIKESFLKFFIALHQALLNFDAKLAERPTSQLLNPVQKVSNKAILSSTAALTLDVVQTRAFLSQSEMSLSDYTIETLSAAINPDAKDKVTLIQALRTTVDLSAKARIVDEIKAMKVLLKYLQQRISLLYILNEQEKEQWRTSVNVSLQELEQNDPIAISSYAIILNTIEEWDLSKERILEEWRNPETSILRLHQIMFIILLTKPQNQFYELVDEYKKWLAMNQLPADSIRKRSLDKRFMILRDFLNKGRMRLTFLRLLLVTIQYIQMSYEIKNWEPNPAYIIEDLLAVETPLKKFRQIQTILSTKPSSDVVDLTQKFKDVLMDRFQQSASGYSYYTDEERQLMEKRLRQCENLSHRPDWKNSRDKLIYAVCRLMMRPIRGIAETETK